MSPFHNVLPWRQLTIVALSICLTLVTAGTVLAKTTTWTNAAPADDNWSTAGNWDNGVPVDFDRVYFDPVSGTSNQDIPGLYLDEVDMTGYAGTLTIPYGLNVSADLTVDGTLDAVASSVDVAGGITVVGVLDATSGAISVAGDLDVEGTMTANGGSVVTIGGNLSGGSSCDIDLSNGTVDVYGDMVIQGDLHATGATVTARSNMQVQGTLLADGSSLDVAYDFSGGYGAVMDMGSAWVSVGGGVFLANVASATWTTGVLAMNGLGGPRSIALGPNSNVLYELHIASASPTDVIDLECSDSTLTVALLLVASGTLELRAADVTLDYCTINSGGALNGMYENTLMDLTGDLTVRETFSCTQPGFTAHVRAGGTVDVTSGGTFEIVGSASNRSVLEQDGVAGGTQWILSYDATSTITIDYVEVQDSDAQGPTPVVATNSLDKGNNTNWDFGPKVTTWTNAAPADDNWSNYGNWDNGVPGDFDRVYFNPVSGTSNQDIAGLILDEVDMTGYAGTLTVPYGLTLNTDLTVDGTLDASSSNIDIGGNIAVAGVLDASSSTISVGGSVGVEGTMTADASSVVSVGGNFSGGSSCDVDLSNGTVDVVGDMVIDGDLNAEGTTVIVGANMHVGDTLLADGLAATVAYDFSGGYGAVMDMGSADVSVGGGVFLANVASATWTTGKLTMNGLGGARSMSLGPGSDVLNDLEIASASATDVIDLECTDDSLTVATLTVQSGTLDLGAVRVKSGETDIAVNGTLRGKYENTRIDFTGNVTVRGSFSYTQPGFMARLQPGGIIDVTSGGTFEVVGSATNRCALMQDLATGGAQWILSYDATSTITVDYVEVQDSDAQGPTPVVATNSYDMGNNDNWDFQPVGVDDAAPLRLSVVAAPNPFNPSTTIRYELPSPGHVSMRIYDATGGLVRTLVSGHQPPGRYRAVWEGRNDAGQHVGSGVYFCRLESVDGALVHKLVLLK
jgi:hypothetical protein